MTRLRARGLTFEELDYGPDDRTVDGLMTSAAGSGEALNVMVQRRRRQLDLMRPATAGTGGRTYPMIAASNLRRTVDGIIADSGDGSLNAWFTDSEGNILGLVEGQGDHMT